MLIQSADSKGRKFDPGVRDFIQYFDKESVMERAWDEDRKRHCIELLRKDEQSQLIDEIGHCQDNFEYCCRNYFEIVDEKGVERPFVLWPSQMLVLEKMYELQAKGRQAKLMIIKARRLGCSSLIESLAAHTTMFKPNQYAEIISYNSDHATYLFQMLLHILDKLPWWMKPMVASRKEEEGLYFDNPNQDDRRFNPGLGSKILVEAVTQVRGVGGQGKRVSFAHLSEWADWDGKKAKTLILEDLKPALGESIEHVAFLESTAKGVGNFSYKFWWKNVRLKEDAEWYPLFMPWFFEKNRVMSIPEPKGSDGARAEKWTPPKKETDMRDRAMRDWFKCTDPECDEYRESVVYPELFDEPCPRCRVGKMMPLLLSDQQLRWMYSNRINAEDDEEQKKLLNQEYASTAEAAFVISGYQVFSDDILEYVNSTVMEPIAIGDFDSKGNFHGVNDKHTKKCYQASWCEANHTYDENPLRIWKFPEQERAYVCGVDVSEGLGGESDYSVAFVLKLGRFAGEPDEHVATYRSNEIDPLPFGAVCNWLGRWYNEALMSVEANKYDTTLSQLRQTWLYPNVFRWKWVDSTNMLSNKWGWYTNQSSKPRLWQTAKKWLKDRSVILYSSNCLEELKRFQKESPEDRGASAEEGMHDDEGLSFMIALYTGHDMDVGENVVYSTPLKVNNGPQIEARGAWTATCTRCMAPAWQIDNPEYGRCPKCGCRMISAKPNMKVKSVNEIDFAEIGREPEIAGQAGLTSFEYTNTIKD